MKPSKKHKYYLVVLVFLSIIIFIAYYYSRNTGLTSKFKYTNKNNTRLAVQSSASPQASVSTPIPAVSQSPAEPEVTTENNSGAPRREDDLVNAAQKMIDEQEKIDKSLLAELDSGEYTFEDPLIVVNPYNIAPLTALALFTSEEPLNISIHVEGKTKLADVDFTFDGYNTRHMIPVYGLYANTYNKVTLTAKSQEGLILLNKLEIKTEPLPNEHSKNIIQTELNTPDKYNPGFNFSYKNKTMFDVNGDYRWFLKAFSRNSTGVVFTDYNGDFIIPIGDSLDDDNIFYFINRLGKISRVYYTPYGVHHDIVTNDIGNIIVTGSKGDTIEDFIYEIDINSGEIINSIDLKEVLQRTRKSEAGFGAADWFHNNSIVYKNNEIVISGRHQSVVAKLSWPEGSLKWILSNHNNWVPLFWKYLLSPTGTGFEWQYNQHSAKILPDIDNDVNTVDIILFDNGNERLKLNKELQRAIYNNEIVEPENYSRIVHYRINEKTMQVEQIWQFGKELGESFFSNTGSGVTFLANKNYLASSNVKTYTNDGSNTDYAVYIEINTNKDIVWQAHATSKDVTGNYTEYRVDRFHIYNDYANNLNIGIQAKNFIPSDVLPIIPHEPNSPLATDLVKYIINTKINDNDTATVNIENKCGLDLYSDGNNPVNIGVRIYDKDNNFIKEDRIGLGRKGLLNGQIRELVYNYRNIDLKSGEYKFEFMLVQEAVAWFEPENKAIISIDIFR